MAQQSSNSSEQARCATMPFGAINKYGQYTYKDKPRTPPQPREASHESSREASEPCGAQDYIQSDLTGNTGSWMQGQNNTRATANEFNRYVDSLGTSQQSRQPSQCYPTENSKPPLYSWDMRWMPERSPKSEAARFDRTQTSRRHPKESRSNQSTRTWP